LEHITLPVLDDNSGTVVSREVLEVEPLAQGGLTLLHSPAFVDGLAGGDTIELDSGQLCGYRLVKRGGNAAIVLALSSEAHRESEATKGLLAQVARLGGVFDGGPSRVLVFTVPARSAFGEMERSLDAFCAANGEATWWFGNVYDADGKPLNWWNGE